MKEVKKFSKLEDIKTYRRSHKDIYVLLRKNKKIVWTD